jgi:hypothetical protein
MKKMLKKMGYGLGYVVGIAAGAVHHGRKKIWNKLKGFN